MPDYRHMRSGSLNTPNSAGSHSPAGAAPGSAGAAPRFDGPRSPPNTSHVPCKFFRQGTCQAGSACPFSHDLGVAADTVCKYFAKGNCKFGPKCANIHVLPDGRRINYGKNGVTIGPGPINLAGRSPHAHPHTSTSPPPATATVVVAAGSNGQQQQQQQHHHSQPSSTSALTNSLYGADAFAGPPPAPFPFDSEHGHQTFLGRQPSLDNGLPLLDVPYSNSQYGSPRDDVTATSSVDRFGLALSPGIGLSVLDAPLPASFDSNGISNAARFPAGPWPSSVPNKFGFEASSPSAKDARTSDTLKLLHTSAFGGSDRLTPAGLTGSSPPGSHHGNGSGTEEYFGKRPMHSSRFPRPNILSASLPKTASSVDRDWTQDFAFDEDNDNLPENYVPENLQDLLTPAEKARRGSIRADDVVSVDGLPRYGGSPIGTSPSRWAPVFAAAAAGKDEELSRSANTRSAASAFGHVGSPLRNSVLAQAKTGHLGSSPSSRPPAMRSGSDSLSMLSQQLERSRLDDTLDGSGAGSHLHPGSARSPPSGPIRVERHSAERHVSSGSIGSPVTGRLTTPIDEEEVDGGLDTSFVFNMEEVNGEAAKAARKRLSNSLGMGQWTGNYASVVSGKTRPNGTNGTNGTGTGASGTTSGGKKNSHVPVNGQ